MNANVIHVGVDVDDARYHVAALNRQTGEVLSFDFRPMLSGLIRQLEKLNQHFDGAELKLCHEASYVGFSLQRDLSKKQSVGMPPSPIRVPASSTDADRRPHQSP